MATKTPDWFVYIIEMQKILQKELLAHEFDLLDVNERLLTLECRILPSILKDIEKSTSLEKIVAEGMLTSACEFALSSPLKFPPSLHLPPMKNIDGASNVNSSYLWEAQVKQSGFLLSELVTASNFQYLMVKLHNFYLPTRSKVFAEVNGCSQQFSQEGAAELLDALLSFHPEIAYIKKIRPDITDENLSLKHRLATLWNDETNLAQYIALLVYRNGLKDNSPTFEPYHFKDLEAYTAWAIESVLLRLIVIGQDAARFIDTMQAIGQEPFKLMVPKLTTTINLRDLASQFEECEKLRAISSFEKMLDALPKIGAERVLKDNLDIKLLQLELRNAILNTSTVIKFHPLGCTGGITPILGVLTDFLQACIRIDDCVNHVASLVTKPEFLHAYKKVAEDAKCLNQVRLEPKIAETRSRVNSSGGHSPRGGGSSKNSPRGPTSAKNSPRNLMTSSADASSTPITIPSVESSPRESAYVATAVEVAVKSDRVLPVRVRESPGTDRRNKADLSVRSRTLLKSLNRKSSGGLTPFTDKTASRRSEEAVSLPEKGEDTSAMAALTSKPRSSVKNVFAQSTAQPKAQPPEFVRRKSEPAFDTETLGAKLSQLAAARAQTQSAEPDVPETNASSSDKNPKL
ncbi:MAG: hypothetical protein M3R00_00510 [Pseudomonadota bacterium]|nr:hypothetical protein [Pseudomonadota bacterium]